MGVAAQSVQAARQHWMGVLAKANLSDLQECWQQLAIQPDYQFIRKPETGLVMTRGRMGGSGQLFNTGEVTLTRCAVRLDCGVLGVSYVMGRSKQHALIAALADSLLQGEHAELLQAQLIQPLAKLQKKAAQEREAAASATKVDFFTMVRGEDE